MQILLFDWYVFICQDLTYLIDLLTLEYSLERPKPLCLVQGRWKLPKFGWAIKPNSSPANLSSNNSQLSRYVVGIGIRLLNCLQNKIIQKFYSIRTFCYTLPKNIIKTLVEMSVEGNLWDGPLKRSVVILVSHA